MNSAYIRKCAKRLRDQVDRERRVVWEWKRWKRWTRDEISILAEIAGVCFAGDGDGGELVFFGW